MYSLTQEIFRTCPLIIYIISIVYFLIFKSMFSLFIVIGLSINGIIWIILHPIFKKYFPDLAKRPCRCSCYFYETNKPILAGGMPSGHCQSIGFLVTFIVLYIFAAYYNENSIKIITAIISLYLITFMIYSRAYYYRCHTRTQAIVGTIIGIITGYVMWEWYNLLIN